MDSVACRKEFSFKSININVLAKELEDSETMLMKLQLHIKLTRRIAHIFFLNSHIEIRNNKITEAGSPDLQAVEVHSSSLGMTL